MRSRLGRLGYLVATASFIVATALLTAVPALASRDEPSSSPSPVPSSEASASQDPSDTPTSDPTPSAAPAGEGDDSDEGGDTPTPSGLAEDDGTARRQTSGVTIVDDAFNPAQITVDAGTEITWTNTGANPHTVTADDGSFGSGTLQNGDDFSSTFDTPGTFAYYCEFHGGPSGTGMSGVVVVRSTGTGGTDPGGADPGGDAFTDGATDLPATGRDLTAAVVAALLLATIGVGSLLLTRRRASQLR